MSRTVHAVYTAYLPLKSKLKVDFFAMGAHVSTVADLPRRKGESAANEESDNGLLKLHLRTTIDPIDSVSESARYMRPVVLVILGILSYMTGDHYSVYQNISAEASTDITDAESTMHAPILIDEENDLSEDLSKILEIINGSDTNKKTLMYSLLDRWRKAQYLEDQSEAGLYDDEAVLAYFHTMELLVTDYQRKQKEDAELLFSTFLSNLFSSVYKYKGPSLQNRTSEKFKHLKEIFLEADTLTITPRIHYMLEQLGMLTTKSHAFVEALVQARNAIAHGRRTFKESLLWPLPPFFMLSADPNIIDITKVLSARAIAAHFGLKLWEKQWESIHETLDPPAYIIKSAVSESAFSRLDGRDLLDGAYEGIRPSSLVSAYLSKKITYSELEQSLCSFLKAVELSEENSHELLYAAVLLADSAHEDLATAARNLYLAITKNRWSFFSNDKDILRQLEDLGFQPKWFRQWFENGRQMPNEPVEPTR